MTTAELRAIAKLDGKPFEGEIEKLGNKVSQFGSAQLAPLKGMIAGAFSVGAIVSFGRNLLKVADDLQTAANTFDISLVSMIAFKSVMAESGIGTERFMRIFGKLNSSVSEAKRGVTTYTDAFNMMNISQKEMIGLGMDKILELMAKKYEEANNKAEFLAGTSKAFGERIGPVLIEVFQRINKEGLEKFTEEAEKAASGIEKMAKVSDKLEKGWDKTKDALFSFIGGLGELAEKGGEEFAIEFEYSMGRIDKKLRDHLLAISKAARIIRIGFEGPPAIVEEETEKERIKRARETERWYKLKEDSLLRQMSTLAQIAYFEEEITKLREAQTLKPADLEIASDILEREKKITDLYKKRDEDFKKEEDHREKIIRLLKEEDELALDYAERQKDIMAGKGIEAPREARVDVMQAIGLIVGGIAGGDAAGRRAERAEKIQQAQTKLLQESKQKLEEISDRIFELGAE